MACNVERDDTGKILTVKTDNGQDSKLFEELRSNIYFNSDEVALQIYSNAYSEDVKNTFNESLKNTYETGEPKVYFKDTKGNIVEDIEDVIISGNVGNLDLGFKNPSDGSFMRVASFNTSLTPKNKVITNHIAKGTIEAKLTNGKIMGKGSYVRSKVLLAKVFKEEASPEIGEYIKVEQDGSITIADAVPQYIPVFKKDGSIEVISQDEIKRVLRDKNVLHKEELFIRDNDLITKTSEQIKNNKTAPKNKLHETRLLNFLDSLGISVVSMDNYKASYKVRHGDDTDVAGLIDLTNRVVAIAEGVNVSDVITEEVAHLAIEAYSDQASIISAMVEVESTQEYRDWADTYRAKYSDEFSGVELENKVRKEILGKVLARSIQEDNFTEEVGNLWQRFVNYISSRFTTRKRVILDDIVKKIRKDISDENFSSFSDVSIGEGVFFSLKEGDKIENEINRGFKELANIANSFKKHNVGNFIGTLERIEAKANNLTKMENTTKLVGTLRANLNILSKKTKNSEGMTQMDNTVFQSYNSTMPQVLKELRRWMENTEFGSITEKSIAEASIKDITNVLSYMDNMEISLRENSAKAFPKILAEVLDNSSLSEKEKEGVKASFDALNKDTGFFQKLFTPLSQSNNPFLNVLGKLVKDMYTQMSVLYKNASQKYTNEYAKQGWSKFEKSIIGKDKEGKNGFFYEDAVNWQDMEDNRYKHQIEQLQKLRPEVEKAKLEELFDKKTIQEVLEETDDSKTNDAVKTEMKAYQKAMNEWELDNNTSRFKKEYYKELEFIEEVANVTDSSKVDLQAFRRNKYEVTSKAITNGKVDMSKLSERDKESLDKINRAERIKSSPIDSSGGLYPGLKVAKWADLTAKEKATINAMQQKINGQDFQPSNELQTLTVLDEGSQLDDLSVDARFVLDNHNLKLVRGMSNKAKGRSFNREGSQEFFNEVKRIFDEEGREEAFKFLQANSRITYSDSYYDSMDTSSPDYVALAQEQINEESNQLKKEKRQLALDNYKKTATIRREILKSYKNSKDSTEVEVEDITFPLRERIKELDEELERLRREIGAKVEIDNKSATKKEVGAYYKNQVKDSGNSAYEIALENMTASNRIKVESFKDYFQRSIDTNVHPVKEFEEFAAKMFESGDFTPATMTREEAPQVLAKLFAETKMASYMYSYKIPNERAELEGNIKKNIENITEDMLVNKGGNLQVNPDYQWTANEVSPDMLDPEYNPSKGKTPRLEKYRNKNYYAQYGITEEEWLNSASPSELTPRANVERFNYLKALTDVNKTVNEKTNSKDNIFLRPQISKTAYEKVKTGLKIRGVAENVKESVKEFYTDRVDIREYGNKEMAEIGAKLPPKMYRQRLEDASILSDDTFSASMLLLKEAHLYEQRMNTKHKIEAVQNKLLNSDFKTGMLKKGITVKGQASEVLKAYNEAFDYHVFGVKQTLKLQMNMAGMEVDLTPFIIKMQKISSLGNLIFNPAIAATSGLTGIYNNIENILIGQHYSKSSVKRAMGLISAHAGDFTMQAGKINNTSWMGGLVEFFNILDTSERLENSAAGRGVRVALKSTFALDRLANMPVVQQTFYSVLCDYRFVDGKYMPYSGFVTKQKTENKGISKSEINNKWKALEKDSIIDALQNDEGSINIKESKKGRLTEEQWKGVINEVSAKAKNLAQQVDGQLSEADKLGAQRNVILNTMMQHRGWMFINAARMLKGRHFNFQTNMYEEGTLHSALAFAKDVLLYKGNAINAFKGMDDLSKANLKRVGLQVVMLQALFYLALFLKGGDDDDDSFAEDFGRYIVYRTYGESSTLTPIGMYNAVRETIRQPVVMTTTWQNMGKVIESTYNDKDDDFGVNFRKVIGAKSYDQYYKNNVDDLVSGWLFHNREVMGRIYSDGK